MTTTHADLLLSQHWARTKYAHSPVLLRGSPGSGCFTMPLWRLDTVKRAELLDVYRYGCNDWRFEGQGPGPGGKGTRKERAPGWEGWHRDIRAVEAHVGGTQVRAGFNCVFRCLRVHRLLHGR